MLQLMALFQAKESRDELGLGAIRDSFSDQLFPGTSTIQTRLRYMLFVPWIYQGLENKRTPANIFAVQADKLERALVQPLIDSEDNSGVFGKTAGKRLKRLPSSVYWSGLGAWGIRLMDLSQSEYHLQINDTYRNLDRIKRNESCHKSRGDDADFDHRKSAANWHPKLPAMPVGFPEHVELKLTKDESAFFQECIKQRYPQSLLAFLVFNAKPAVTDFPWQHPDYRWFSDTQKNLLKHARLFSDVMHGAALSYNFQLSQRSNKKDLIKHYEDCFDEWQKNLNVEEIKAWSLQQLWQLTNIQGHIISEPTRTFVQRWVELVRLSAKGLLRHEEGRLLIEHREIKLKGARSRFKNETALAQWGGSSGVDRLNYRWPNVKVLLDDLNQGLGQK